MSNIEVGDYIRTESGIIEKIKTFDEQTNIFKDKKGKLQKWLGETVFGDPYCEEIVKHSKNIIDLIEVGDYVNGHLVINIETDKNNKRIITENKYFDKYYEDGIAKIKSIVTKEQFKEMEYRIDE